MKGDLVSAYSLVEDCADKMNCHPSLRIARAFVGGSDPAGDLGLSWIEKKCNYADLCSDGYAVIFAEMLKESEDVHGAAVRTFIDNAGNEFKALLQDVGSGHDLLEMREKVSNEVTKFGAEYLSRLENDFRESNQEVKDICIWAYVNWLYLLCD